LDATTDRHRFASAFGTGARSGPICNAALRGGNRAPHATLSLSRSNRIRRHRFRFGRRFVQQNISAVQWAQEMIDWIAITAAQASHLPGRRGISRNGQAQVFAVRAEPRHVLSAAANRRARETAGSMAARRLACILLFAPPHLQLWL